MKNFVEQYPEFKKLSGNVSKHVKIVEELQRYIQRRQLLTVSELEQELSSHHGHADALNVSATRHVLSFRAITHIVLLHRKSSSCWTTRTFQARMHSVSCSCTVCATSLRPITNSHRSSMPSRQRRTCPLASSQSSSNCAIMLARSDVAWTLICSRTRTCSTLRVVRSSEV